MENLKERKTGFSKKLKFHIYIRAKYWACRKVAADIGSDMSTPHKISMSFQFHKWFLRPCNSPWCDCVLSVSSDYSGILADVAADLSQRLLWSQGAGSPSGRDYTPMSEQASRIIHRGKRKWFSLLFTAVHLGIEQSDFICQEIHFLHWPEPDIGDQAFARRHWWY